MIKMKESGVDWIGDIPMDWNLVQTKRYFRNKKQIVGSAVDEYERLALTLNGVVKRSKDDNEGLQPEKFEGYQILCKNEIVFKLIDLENVKTSRVGLSPFTGLVSPAYIVISNNSEDNRFYYYWFMFMYYNEVFNHLGGAGVRSALNAKDVMMLPIPDIALSLQKRIADYLDEKCAKIDAIIEKQQAVIEKLKEYKLSVITEAVTKGLDSDVEMKDSGVEWIGNTPSSWNCIKLSRIIIETQNGITRRDLEVSEGNIVLKLKNITASGEIDYKEVNRIKLSDSELHRYKLADGDFIFVRVNGSKSLVGKCAIFENIGEPVAYNDHIIRVKIDEGICNKSFLQLYLQSIPGKREIELGIKTSAGQFTISSEGLKAIKMPLPSLDLQQEIVNYLNHKCVVLDSFIKKRQIIIEKLTEYKKSLIYEVVTGKKEV